MTRFQFFEDGVNTVLWTIKNAKGGEIIKFPKAPKYENLTWRKYIKKKLR